MKHPHAKKCKCGSCALEGTKCDAAGKGYPHCFIRIIANPYLSCMYWGRWRWEPEATEYESDKGV